jgi:tetratricopeptide (TPR) repeat protein
LNNLGLTLKHLKKFESAEAAYRESLEIKERLYGRKHKETSITLSNLADTLRQRGKFEASETMFRESLEIKRRTFGKNHEETAKSKFAVLTHSCVIL